MGPRSGFGMTDRPYTAWDEIGMHFSSEERRRHERVTVPPIEVEMEGLIYRTNNWSMGGFMIEGYEGRHTPGSLFTLERIASRDGALEPVKVRARVVRSDPRSGRLVVGFLAVDEAAYVILRDHMAERMKALRQQQAL